MNFQIILLYGVIFANNAANICETDNCPIKCKDLKGPLSPKSPTIIFRRSEGGLGNRLNSYVMMLQFKRKCGYDSYLTKDTYQIIRKLFTRESIELPVLEDTFCNVDNMNFDVYTGDFVELISNKSYHSFGKMYELFPVQTNINPFIPPYQNPIYQKHTRDQYQYLHNRLKVYPKYLKAANRTLQKVAKKMKLTREKISFIGMHHRQTDMTEQKKLGNEPVYDERLFYHYMKVIRKKFDPVAFLYVSDDMPMGYKQMQKRTKDLFFVGKGECKQENDKKRLYKCNEDDNRGHDFAILVQSNHTITSEGSFSLWASVLNNGQKYGVGEMSAKFLNYGPDHAS